jgi:ubiquinone/menaquinone biosynthesis C-methylase UbiE
MIFSKEQFLELKQAYQNDLNLTQIIAAWGIPINFEVISFIYELQAGTYTLEAKRNPNFLKDFSEEISRIMSKHLGINSLILDCGTGESNSFIPILKNLNLNAGVGVDSSISRLTWAKVNADESGIILELACADLGNLPLQDDSVDAVLTVHALEPNGGRENELIKELGRVAKNYIFLVEPDYEDSTLEQQSRMDTLHYIRNLGQAIKFCGFKTIEKIPVVNNANILNKASITVIDTCPGFEVAKKVFSWADPIFGQLLHPNEGGLTNEIGLWYPTVRNIPLLRESDTQYLLSPS